MNYRLVNNKFSRGTALLAYTDLSVKGDQMYIEEVFGPGIRGDKSTDVWVFSGGGLIFTVYDYRDDVVYHIGGNTEHIAAIEDFAEWFGNKIGTKIEIDILSHVLEEKESSKLSAQEPASKLSLYPIGEITLVAEMLHVEVDEFEDKVIDYDALTKLGPEFEERVLDEISAWLEELAQEFIGENQSKIFIDSK